MPRSQNEAESTERGSNLDATTLMTTLPSVGHRLVTFITLWIRGAYNGTDELESFT